MDKPLLIFDGDCGFCRLWIERWKKIGGDGVDFLRRHGKSARISQLIFASEAFQKAVQLVEPDGHHSAAAEAVFRVLKYAGSPGWLWAYEKIPGFAVLSEYGYGIVAGHRPIFSMMTGNWVVGRALTGGSCGIGAPSSYRQVRWLFLRAMAVIYAVAFWSFGLQARGLIGSRGIFPTYDFLSHLIQYGAARFWYVPTLAWLNSSDTFLLGMCVAGVLFSFLLLIFNIVPRYCLIALWVLYLSLVSIGGDFGT